MRKVFLLLALLIAPTLGASDVEYKISELLDPVVMVKLNVSSGSGVVVYSKRQAQGYRTFILTNFHVVDGAVSIRKSTGVEVRQTVAIHVFKHENEGRDLTICATDAYIVGYNKTLDIALLEVTDRSLHLTFATLLPRDIKLGLFGKVWNVGCPGGEPINFAPGMITQLGDDMYFGEFGTEADYIRTNSPIYFGSSGGATFLNKHPEYYLIGMPTRIKSSKTPYVNYSVSIDSIRKFLKEKDYLFIENQKRPIPAHVKPIPPPPPEIEIEIDFEDMFEFMIPFGPPLPDLDPIPEESRQ